ncbi:phospholipase [Microbacterium sp. 10M-3C3]|uniref:aggregation-promoting factor C-terminal-like domain-containing protein n=1 Tax=Microbacterium sp. 10M-3C3 TaxID=2483401 RepID=UPI000F642544|nr:phospholipase [Microbacterium sp. 10M-3C3]
MRSVASSTSALRRSLLAVTVCAGAAAAAFATTGLAAAPASAPIAAGAAAVTAAAAPAGAAAVPTALATADRLTATAADVTDALDSAQRTVDDATELNGEVAASGLDVGADAAVDTAALQRAADDLARADVVPMLLFPELAADTETQTSVVAGRVTELRERFEAAKSQRAAEQAAAEAQRKAEAAAAAEAQRQAEALAAANTPEGAKATARQLAADTYGWGDGQFSCLASLWQKESSWNYRAYNASSGATGIPQALPGSKMASFGSDWATSARTQIAWGLDYISRAYGTPCAAWGHSQATNWY